MKRKHVVVVGVGVLLGRLVAGVALVMPGSGVTSTLLSAGTFTRNAHATQSATPTRRSWTSFSLQAGTRGGTPSEASKIDPNPRTTARGDHMTTHEGTT